MAGLMTLVVSNYNDIISETVRDPVVDSWFLMGSPYPLFAIIAVYLYFVLSAGPKYMANKQPYNLQYLLVAYNAYQVVFSMWLCTLPFRYGALTYFTEYGCKPIDHSRFDTLGETVSVASWWYFFSKIVELLDTVFFVLRKKQNQVTFLHVYHHSATALFSWGYLKYLPGEQGVIIGCLNSLVHVVMYFYYMVAAMGPKYQKYLWWKKYMTWIQLGQFCLMLTYLTTLLAYDCKLPKALTFFFVANCVIFLYLFAQFYRKAYVNKPKSTSSKNNNTLSHAPSNTDEKKVK